MNNTIAVLLVILLGIVIVIISRSGKSNVKW
jgi:hypothetical protein